MAVNSNPDPRRSDPDLRSWLEQAYPILERTVRRVGGTVEVDDILQEILLHLLEQKSRFTSFEMFIAYARQLARWRSIDSLRRHARETAIGGLEELERYSSGAGGQNAEQALEASDYIASRLATLPPREREVMVRTLQGETPDEIAHTLALAPATVRSFQRRARYHLAIKDE